MSCMFDTTPCHHRLVLTMSTGGTEVVEKYHACKFMPDLAASLCCRDSEGPNARHDVCHHITRPEAVHQPLVLSLQPGVPVHLCRQYTDSCELQNWNAWHAGTELTALDGWQQRAQCFEASRLRLGSDRAGPRVKAVWQSPEFVHQQGEGGGGGWEDLRDEDKSITYLRVI